MPGQDISAGASPRDQPGEVPGPVTDQRGGFFAQSGDHHLPHFSGLGRLQGLRVDDLQDVVIRPVMDPFMGRALQPGSRAVELGQTRDVEGILHTQVLFYIPAHGFAVTFRPEDDLRRSICPADPAS